MDTDILTALGDSWREMLLVMALLMARMLVAFSVIPLFVGNSIPRFIQAAFVAALSLALLPMALADEALTTLPAAAIPFYAAKEAAIGLVLGLLASVGFWAMYAAGSIIGYQAALGMATAPDPFTGRPESLMATLVMQLFIALFLFTGGMMALIDMLFQSYRLWPLTSMTPLVGNLALTEAAVGALVGLFAMALKVAAPFVILMLLLELALGFLSRFAPQLNVFLLALPIKVTLLALMLLLYSMLIFSQTIALPVAEFPPVLESMREALDE